ncbi:hypothetical protein [Bacillus cereus]
MKKILEGNRIFKEEGDFQTRYLIFPKEKINTYVDLTGYFVKHGDLNKPVKWYCPDDKYNLTNFVRPEEFDASIYEYIFYTDFGFVRELQKILKPYGFNINNDMSEFLKIKEISKEITDFLKMGLIEKDCSLIYPDDFTVVEGYEFEHLGQHYKFIIGEDYGYYCTDITYDYTSNFLQESIIEHYYKDTAKYREYILKTNKGKWYKYYPGDTANNYWILEDLYEEDLIVLNFKEYIMEKNDSHIFIKKDTLLDIPWPSFIDKDTQYDFYFSNKEFCLQILQEDNKKQLACIDGEWKKYTKRVRKGDKVYTLEWEIKWDDLEFLGTSTIGETREEEMSRETMERLLEDIRKNSPIMSM